MRSSHYLCSLTISVLFPYYIPLGSNAMISSSFSTLLHSSKSIFLPLSLGIRSCHVMSCHVISRYGMDITLFFSTQQSLTHTHKHT